MKNVFKKILIFIILIYGLWYVTDGMAAELRGINLDEIGSDLNKTNTRKELVLVNMEHGLSIDYKPEGLTVPNIPFASGVDKEEKYVAGIIAKPIEELVNAAKEEGIILLGNSGYRSYKSQKDVYTSRIKTDGKKLAENCYRFGFIIRYPYGKQNITGIEYEPWHIRYVGKEAAKYIYDNRITLEEYLAQ